MSNWQPGASLAMLRRRAELLANLRHFFFNLGVNEVDVPVLGRSTVTDSNIESITTDLYGGSGYLQTSPEYFMKRLLAAGSGDIYCLGKAFRNGEAGQRHNPEFTLLEWYRCGWDEHQLMDEVADLINQVYMASGQLPLAVHRGSYADYFAQALAVDPHTAPLEQLQQLAVTSGSESWAGESRANCLDLLFSLRVEPQLPEGLVFVYDYPICQSALAQTTTNGQGQNVSRRFEAFIDGMELANGYFELRDGAEQQQRFAQDLKARSAANKPRVAVDSHLVDALHQGLPSCAGVALGVDRLLMQLQGAGSIAEVMPFSWERC
ncbi:MAG: EF-P lysine aminoacylase EpmA [Porticoccaceae bacterium]